MVEMEEWEACFLNNDDDDPDVSLSYIDMKIQKVLGHCQKDFKGGVSAENLGEKFGDYGSFLPAYQCSPVWPRSNTLAKNLNYSVPVSPNSALIEGSNQNSGCHSNASQPIPNGSVPRKSKSNSKLKQEVNTSCGNKSESVSNFANDSDQKSLMVQIEVGSDNMLTKRNVEIYTGLGLNASPSLSLEANESPTCILKMMTSFPVSGSLLLSPLTDDVLHLTEKKPSDNSCGLDLVNVDQNIVGEKSRSTEKNSVSVGSTNGVLAKKETSMDNFAPGSKISSSGGKRKAEGGLKNESFTSKTKKNDNGSKRHTEDFKNNGVKVKDTYKDFFGELDIEHELNDETGSEDWVCCDKCEKWRLLPPGQNPGCLPEKWICGMLDWLPGMNRCSISEEETTKAITSRFPSPSVQGSQPVHRGGPHLGVISHDGAHQRFGSKIMSCSVKNKHGLEDLTNEAKWDGPSLSSSSSKKKLHSYKTEVNEVEFQDSGQPRGVIMEKDKLKREEDKKLCENLANEGNNIHHSKINNKSESTQDFLKMFMNEDGNGEASHTGKFDKRDVLKKRQKVKGTCETYKEKKSFDEVKNIKDMNFVDSSRQYTVRAATSSSSKVSGSHKTSGRNKSKELPLNKNVRNDIVSTQDYKKHSKKDVSIKGKSSSLPPKGQSEVEQKENDGNDMSLKGSKHNKKSSVKHKEKKHHPTAVLVRDLSNQATTNALREATNIKHMADRLKNKGSNLESRALYMEAALKFLQVASLFESCHSQTGRYGDMIQSISIYNSTAKLCKYCADEYERTKEMATASLAYKCMEVAYMKVVYSSIATSCKDVTELQTFLHIGTSGESPSSSASAYGLDTLNNLAAADMATLAKGVSVTQMAGNHVIAAKNKPNLTRILSFTENVNWAMEASMKSRIAFAASCSKEETVLSAIKRALDFSFHDVEELLQRVRVAMELINR